MYKRKGTIYLPFLLECKTVTLLFHLFFPLISCYCVTCFEDTYTGKHGTLQMFTMLVKVNSA